MSNEMITASGKSKGEYPLEIQYYMDIVDPRTGKPYMIPMLTMADAGYLSEYADYMKLKERDPAAFEKILNWG